MVGICSPEAIQQFIDVILENNNLFYSDLNLRYTLTSQVKTVIFCKK